MNIAVLVKLVPDLVEELSIDSNGIALDTEWLRLIINEFDDHAIEQAILIKEKSGANVTIIAADGEGVDDVLFTTLAKGVDRVIKLVGELEDGINTHAMARAFAPVVQSLSPDLVLTGVQAHNDLDGSVGPIIAEYLGMPYTGYIAGIETSNGSVKAKKEYPGGLIAEMDIKLPAVLGIQAADTPPRYVAISKVRQSMKTETIEEKSITVIDKSGGPLIGRMFQPETGERAAMIDGDEEEVAEKLIDIFKELGVL